VVQARNRRGPIRWAGPAPDQADPTGGRHAFDAEAALTPIFTTLRRGDWRADPEPAFRQAPPHRPLRTVPDQVERFRDDPWTAPIPVVPPLHAVPDGGYGAGPSAAVPPPSDLETTMSWRVVDAPVAPPAVHDLPAVHDSRWDEAADAGHRFGGPRYDPPAYGPTGYDQGYEPAAYGPPVYPRAGHDPAVYDLAPYEPYEPAARGRRSYDPNGYDPAGYNPVRDTGRHHVRLAPAGW
jgi:hypothetical protein